MIDLALDPATGDLLIKDFDLGLVSEIDQIRQNLFIRLRFVMGEWFLDDRIGVPYREYIWVKSPNQIQVENFIKEAILDTEGVQELIAFDSSYDNASRSFSIEFTCRTVSGDLLSDQINLFGE